MLDALLVIIFKWVGDRNDRNDKENGKSYMRRIGRGLQISCHSCHWCHGGVSDAGISFYREALQGWGIHIYSAKIYRLNAKSGYRI